MSKLENYNYCIVCGNNSYGKPQCKTCWNISKEFSDELSYKMPIEVTYEKEINSIFNKKLKAIKKQKNIKNRQLLCNELIGIGLSFPFDDSFQIKAYEEINKLNNTSSEITTTDSEITTTKIETENNSTDYRKQNPADIYCQDGHYVRSKEERAIDDYLYKEAKLLHAYEPKFRLTEQEQQLCKKYGYKFEYFYPDFYIPQYNLYIEFFGKSDEYYKQKMNLKIRIYSTRKDINFKYLTYNDSNILLEKLEDILEYHKQKHNK